MWRLRAVAAAGMLAAGAFAQAPAIVVNGKPVVMTTPPSQVGGELFLPIGPIARALSADVAIGRDQILRVRRSDGATLTYDGRTGEIRAGAVLAGQVKDYRLIHIVNEADQLLFPLSAIGPLFGVNVRDDEQKNILYIDPATGAGGAAQSSNGFSFTDASYQYGLTTNGMVFGQNISLHGEALAGSSTLAGQLQATHIPNGPALYINQAFVRADLSPTRAIILGDQAVYTGIDALSSSMRGAGLEQKLGQFTAYAYGGLAIGSAAGSLGGSLPHYDTRLAGIAIRRADKRRTFAAGLSAFHSPQRQGALFGLDFGERIARNQFNLQAAGGVFSGQSLHTVPLNQLQVVPQRTVDGVPVPDDGSTLVVSLETPRYIAVHGPAYGFTAADAFLPVPQVSISGQWDYYSENFLTSRQDTRFSGASAGTVSMSVRPSRFLTLNASSGNREFLLGDPQRTRTYNYGATLVIPGSHSPQLGYMRSLQFDASSPAGRFDLSQYSFLLPHWGRYSASVYYSQIALGATRISDINALWSVEAYRYGRFGLRYQSQFGVNQRYGADWYFKLGGRDGYLRLGADRLSVYHGASGVLPVVGVRLPLPKRQVLEISYMRDVSSQLLQIQLGGRLMRPHEILRDSRGVPRMNARTIIIGQVYIDANYNAAFDNGDRGVGDVQVWLDGGRMALSDSRGYYRFDNVDPGAHNVRADLTAVPAGFVFAGAGANTVAAFPNRENRMDFRIIRTGRIEGQVTYLDYSEDPDDPKELPMPDVRVVVTGDGDTFTESNGGFLLGDLAPGRYEVRLDPATLPKGYAPQPSSYIVVVTPGGVARQPRFKLVIPPKPVIEIKIPDQKIAIPNQPGARPPGDKPPGGKGN